MPDFNPTDPLAIPALYQHQYDIDALIEALRGATPLWLNTTNGQLTPLPDEAAPATHRFFLEPLPADFLAQTQALTPAEAHTQLKNAALDWLDAQGILPPSMKHINRRTAPLPQGPAKIRLVESPK